MDAEIRSGTSRLADVGITPSIEELFYPCLPHLFFPLLSEI
jgi:hypothetical protein